MSLFYAEVIEERRCLGRQVGDTTCQILSAPDVESYGAEVARKGGDLLEPAPAPEAQAANQEQGWALAADIVIYGAIVGDEHRHSVTSAFFSAPRKTPSGRSSGSS